MNSTISMKAVCVGGVLLLAGIAGGFAAGRMIGGGKTAQPTVEKEAAKPDDVQKKLAKAQKRIAELERDLAAAKAYKKQVKSLSDKVKNSLKEKTEELAGNTQVVSVSTNSDIEAELKRQLPEGAFTEATNVLSRLRSKLAERAKGRLDYIASVDASRMSKKERENHAKFLKLLEKREALRSKMTGFIPNPSVLQEMVELDLAMQPVAKQERSALVREVARELGYSGEDVDVVHDTMVNIYDSTSGGGINSLMEAASDMQAEGDSDNGEAPKVNVGVQTQVIGL